MKESLYERFDKEFNLSKDHYNRIRDWWGEEVVWYYNDLECYEVKDFLDKIEKEYEEKFNKLNK